MRLSLRLFGSYGSALRPYRRSRSRSIKRRRRGQSMWPARRSFHRSAPPLRREPIPPHAVTLSNKSSEAKILGALTLTYCKQTLMRLRGHVKTTHLARSHMPRRTYASHSKPHAGTLIARYYELMFTSYQGGEGWVGGCACGCEGLGGGGGWATVPHTPLITGVRSELHLFMSLGTARKRVISLFRARACNESSAIMPGGPTPSRYYNGPVVVTRSAQLRSHTLHRHLFTTYIYSTGR